MSPTAHAQCLLIASSLTCVVAACTASSDGAATADDDITQGAIDTGDPAVVALLVNRTDTYGGDVNCTGTLVGPRTVMTAAHCAPAFDADAATLHVGIARMGSDGRPIREVIAVARIDVNAQYDASNMERGYDIAFVELARPVTTVAPLPIRRTPMSSADVGAAVRFVGFGYDEHRNIGVKRHVTNRVASVNGNLFTGGTGADTCNGDSGGPALMIVDGVEVVAGVTSFGDPSCTGSGSYSRVDVFAAEVDRAIANAANAGTAGNAEPLPGAAVTPAGSPRVCESRATCLPDTGCTCTTGDVGARCCLDGMCAGGPADPNNCSPRCRRCR